MLHVLKANTASETKLHVYCLVVFLLSFVFALHNRRLVSTAAGKKSSVVEPSTLSSDDDDNVFATPARPAGTYSNCSSLIHI